MFDYCDNEDFYTDGPVACPGCGETFPESALMGSGICADCEAARESE